MRKTPQTTDAKQTSLHFDPEGIYVGWRGKRYLLCDDQMWHLVLEIREGHIADTQCCADVRAILPRPDGGGSQPMCDECVRLHFGTKEKVKPRAIADEQ